MPWEDVTSYSKSDKDRTPRSWEIKLGVFRLVVHRHIHHDPNQWLASCYGIFEEYPLSAVDIYDAQIEALKEVQRVIGKTSDAIIKELP